ncbi:MAG: DNA mismatch repair endonuclease MutL, partial [Myxococcota bacterium]
MNTQIRILPDRVIDQIAAGEVVERPASVVKELVENSIDAGATQVVVALRDGGRGLVRVEDDGRGMGEQDALLAIERHATSKIRETGDLLSLRSLGFRGEALPSIAAVSEFEMVTRRPDDELGTRVRVDGGRLRDVRPTGAAAGTVISARKLFYNIPVRQKFLRTVPTELGHCVHAVVRQAMVRPKVGFVVQHGSRTILDAPATPDWAVRVEALVGPDGRGLLPIDAESEGTRLRGYVATPERHRANAADSTYLFVNGRWVRDQVLRRAVREAYRDRLPSGRHPLTVLELAIDPALADINVHPTKAEVRFIDPASVVRFVAHTVSHALEQAGAPARRSVGRGTPFVAASAPLFAGPLAAEPVVAPSVPDPVVPSVPEPVPPVAAEGPTVEPPEPLPPAPEDLHWIDVVDDRWGLATLGGRLFVADLGRLARSPSVEHGQATGQ